MRPVVSVLVLVVAACGESTAPGFPEGMVGITWNVDSLRVDGERYAPAMGDRPTIRFLLAPQRTDSGTVGGQGGCNDFGGQFVVDGEGVISIRELGSTLKLCTPAAGTAEGPFFNALTRPLRAERAGLRLRFQGDEVGVWLSADSLQLGA